MNGIPEESFSERMGRAIPMALAAMTDVRTGQGPMVQQAAQSLMPPTKRQLYAENLAIEQVRQELMAAELQNKLAQLQIDEVIKTIPHKRKMEKLDVKGKELDIEGREAEIEEFKAGKGYREKARGLDVKGKELDIESQRQQIEEFKKTERYREEERASKQRKDRLEEMKLELEITVKQEANKKASKFEKMAWELIESEDEDKQLLGIGILTGDSGFLRGMQKNQSFEELLDGYIASTPALIKMWNEMMSKGDYKKEQVDAIIGELGQLMLDNLANGNADPFYKLSRQELLIKMHQMRYSGEVDVSETTPVIHGNSNQKAFIKELFSEHPELLNAMQNSGSLKQFIASELLPHTPELTVNQVLDMFGLRSPEELAVEKEKNKAEYEKYKKKWEHDTRYRPKGF